MNCENCNNEHDGKYGSGRFCSCKCARGFSTKEKRQEINIKVGNKLRIYDNKPKYCITCNKEIGIQNKSGYCRQCNPVYLSESYRKSISDSQKKNGNSGGFRIGAGRGKHGWYKGFYLHSTWELAWLVYQLDHNEKIEQCKDKFEYEFEGQKHFYYPDFIWKGQYVEIKGWRYPNTKEKLEQFPSDKKLLLIEGKKDIAPFIKYVKETYGDILSLYEAR